MEHAFKMMITGRRRPGMSFSQMREHMLGVHGPLLISDAQFASTYIERYVQNHVVDGVYGALAPYGRDMVAELTLTDPAKLPQMLSEPHLKDRVQPDEANFAHLTDRVFIPVSEEVVIAPQQRATPTGEPVLGKAMQYMRRASQHSPAEFAEQLHEVERRVSARHRELLKGHVRNVPIGGDTAPYAMVVSLWFDREHQDTLLSAWSEAVRSAKLCDEDSSFAIVVSEHRIHGA